MKRFLLLFAVLTASGQEVAWEARPGFRDFGRMVAAAGVVLTGNVNGAGGTFAFDAATGKLLWRAPGILITGPVTDGRRGFSVNAAVGLSAFDLKSGKVLWKVPDIDASNAANLLVDDGRIFAVGEYGKLRAFEAATGKPIWEHTHFPGPGRASCPTTPVVAGGVLYYAGGEDAHPGQGVFLWALDAASGKELWRFAAKPTPHDRQGACMLAPAVGDGVVVAPSDNVMFGVDAGTGAERWRKEIYRTVDGREYRRSPSSAVIAGGRAYAIIDDGLLGWSARDGNQVFEFKGNFPHSSRIRILETADGLLYFTATLTEPRDKDNPQGFLYALDPATSQIRWSHRVNRDRPYIARWPTAFFHVAGPEVYYENHGILVKVRP